MFKKILVFFDQFEDGIRKKLSKFPIIYAFLGGIGIVLFWRGVWHFADFLAEQTMTAEFLITNTTSYPWWDAPLSFLLGSVILLATGIFVSNFIGNEVIISGLKGEKKMIEKTESELKTENQTIEDLNRDIVSIKKSLAKITKLLDKK